MKDGRNDLRIFFVLGTFGLMGLLGVFSRPTMADIRTVDVVHLIGTGMCFGGAIVALAGFIRRTSEP